LKSAKRISNNQAPVATVYLSTPDRCN